MRVGTTLLVAAIICSARSTPAQQADIKGSRDHPLVPRYAGALIIGYDTREFGELPLALGKVVADDSAAGFAYKLSKSRRVEGRLTRLLYVIPAGRSSLEVFRNYETALKNAGFQPLFSCATAECSFDGNPDRFSSQIYDKARHFEKGTPSSSMAFQSPRSTCAIWPRSCRHQARTSTRR